MNKKRIAIFASGAGSNALNLINFFANHPFAEVSFVLSNKKDAPIVHSCEELGVSVLAFDNHQVEQGDFLVDICQNQGVDLIVLAGFLRKIPLELIQAYPSAIINIHPSLLPKFGGKGMYGMNVHQAVKVAGEKETGITVHLVNENYDEGAYLAQFYTSVQPTATVEEIASSIRILEHQFFPQVVEHYIKNVLK